MAKNHEQDIGTTLPQEEEIAEYADREEQKDKYYDTTSGKWRKKYRKNGKLTEREKPQWYFQRWSAHLPAAGEMVLFDRSWYTRAITENVMGFYTRPPFEEQTFVPDKYP